IAVETPGWRGDGEDRRGASSTDVTRGPEPSTKQAGMDRPRERASYSFADPKVVSTHGREVFTSERAGPPAALAKARETIFVEATAHPLWPWRQRIPSEQRQHVAIVRQQLVDETDQPRLALEAGHRGKPDLPVEPILPGRDHARTPQRIARFALE